MVWYKDWFNSPYYPILYQHRNEQEARIFLDKLCTKVPLQKNTKILDVPCGRGRHSAYLAQNGYHVTGIDLSPESIAYAKENYKDLPNLEFFLHDMRVPFREGYYDYVLNFFTSFGYFETEAENIACLQALANNLNENGKLIIDFFNTEKIVQTLPLQEQKVAQGITFFIKKELQGKFITKTIRFEDKGESYCFQERVMAITLQDFRIYFQQLGLVPIQIYGNYLLEPYDESKPRIIWVLANK